MLFYQWLDKWLEVYKLGNVKEATYNNYKYAIQLIKKNLQNTRIECITEIDIQELLQKLYIRQYSKSTIRLVKLTLTQACKRAIKLHYIVDNPAEDTRVPVMASEKIVDALTTIEQSKIIEASQKDLHGELIIFLLNTGMRKSEMINLKWEDYGSYIIENKVKWYIRVIKSKTKNGVRIIPLTCDAKKIIDSQPHINDYIFNSTNGHPITKTVMRRLCERLKDKTGVDITPHICRHTFATRLYEEDADIKSIAELLGHAKASFTIQRYVTPNFNKKMETISLLEKSFQKST